MRGSSCLASRNGVEQQGPQSWLDSYVGFLSGKNAVHVLHV
jgi:hypothetical protein